jgi:hypothetical protein
METEASHMNPCLGESYLDVVRGKCVHGRVAKEGCCFEDKGATAQEMGSF